MSSGTRYESDAGRKVSGAMGDKVSETNARLARLGMTPRQQELNRLYAFYKCLNYESCRIDWDGTERAAPIDHEAIATAGFLPPGFYDAGATFPIKFRKPSAPYYMVKVIVDRFTGLLFSESQHPKIRSDDHEMEQFLQGIADTTRLWQNMIKNRTYGGSMGVAIAGFQFVNGKPRIEIHDPRWVYPTFSDRFTQELSQIEIRMQYPEEQKDDETGLWRQVWYWYRRVISTTSDIVYEKVPVSDGEEPHWVEAKRMDHGLGFCPVVWTQNLPVQDDIDGDPDCHGIYDIVQAHDALIAQAHYGTLSNCDPTLVAITEAKLAEIRKGSDNAIRLPPGSNAHYLELSGSGAKIAQEMADRLRRYALEVSQCVLEHPDTAAKTATEIERMYSSMYSKTDILREQYAERCVRPLLEMIVRAARTLGTRRREGDTIVRDALYLRNSSEPAKVPAKGSIELVWPPYVRPTLSDVQAAAQATMLANGGKPVLDDLQAAEFIAPYFQVENPREMAEKLRKQREIEQSDLAQASIQAAGGGYGGGEGY